MGRAVVDSLTDREKLIIRLRFGLDIDDEPHTFCEIGQWLGISAERARQILQKAVRKLH